MTAVAAESRVAEHATHVPPVVLRPYVERYVGYRYAGFEAGEHKGLPSRYLTVIISFDDRLELTTLPDGRVERTTFETAVGGLHVGPAVIRHDGDQHGIHLHVTPAGARGLFGLPARELVATVVGLDALWGRTAAAELYDRVAGAASWSERFAVVDRLLLRALSTHVELPSGARRETTAAWRMLTAAAGQIDVATLASEVGWSRRHLTEQFSFEYGVAPKAAARVMRFERSRAMIVRPDRRSLADVAATCGYADQAHMAREWRDMAGASPTAWMAAEALPIVQDDDDRQR